MLTNKQDRLFVFSFFFEELKHLAFRQRGDNMFLAFLSVMGVLLADLIVAVENGTMTYKDAKKEAYTLIYKSVDPNFNPQDRFMVDFCYWDVITVDSAMFNRARKILIEAEDRYKASLISHC